MSRGGSHGGGKSSLSYLFEEETGQSFTKSVGKQAEDRGSAKEANRTSGLLSKAEEKPETKEFTNKVAQEGKQQKDTGSAGGAGSKYHGQNVIFFHNSRPSTKVNSVPGGQSSLGYLFGDS